MGPIELKFLVKTTYDKLAEMFTKYIWSHDKDGHHPHIW